MPESSLSIHDSKFVEAAVRTLSTLLLFACATLLSSSVGAARFESSIGDTTQPPIAEKSLSAASFGELQSQLLSHDANVDTFRARGPFAVTVQKNRELRLPRSGSVKVDVFLSSAAQTAPLVIFVHGQDSSKRAHRNQAGHVASWGMHSLAVQLPNNGPWDVNGKTLASLVELVHRSPQAIDKRIDTSRIILVGHSFGAYSAALALADSAPAAGAILLDPAAFGKDLTMMLRRIRKPVMVLGADDEHAAPRNRDYFFEYIRSPVAELSIRDAVHEDAQYPSEYALHHRGHDPHTTEQLQVTFESAIVASAISIAATGTLDYAWTSFRRAFQDGRFFNPKTK